MNSTARKISNGSTLTCLVLVDWVAPSRPNQRQHWSKTYRNDKKAKGEWLCGLLASKDACSMMTTLSQETNPSAMPLLKVSGSMTEFVNAYNSDTNKSKPAAGSKRSSE